MYIVFIIVLDCVCILSTCRIAIYHAILAAPLDSHDFINPPSQVFIHVAYAYLWIFVGKVFCSCISFVILICIVKHNPEVQVHGRFCWYHEMEAE